MHMSHNTINLNINGTDFEAVVEYTPAWSKPARTHLAPEDCYEAEGEPVIIHSLYMCINVCGLATKQDVWFLIDDLYDDIVEQLNDE